MQLLKITSRTWWVFNKKIVIKEKVGIRKEKHRFEKEKTCDKEKRT